MRLNITKQYLTRIIYMLLSVTLMGFALSLLIRAHMGTDCYSCMNLGISAKLGIPYGPTQLIVNIILFIGMIFVDRSMIGPGTVGNMVIGWLLGSTVGVGTVVVAFTLGPLITFFNKHLSEKVYRNCWTEESKSAV